MAGRGEAIVWLGCRIAAVAADGCVVACAVRVAVLLVESGCLTAEAEVDAVVSVAAAEVAARLALHSKKVDGRVEGEEES